MRFIITINAGWDHQIGIGFHRRCFDFQFSFSMDSARFLLKIIQQSLSMPQRLNETSAIPFSVHASCTLPIDKTGFSINRSHYWHYLYAELINGKGQQAPIVDMYRTGEAIEIAARSIIRNKSPLKFEFIKFRNPFINIILIYYWKSVFAGQVLRYAHDSWFHEWRDEKWLCVRHTKMRIIFTHSMPSTEKRDAYSC